MEILKKRGKFSEAEKLKKALKKKDTKIAQDSPKNAEDYSIDLKDGDIIISATDGVFDNLF